MYFKGDLIITDPGNFITDDRQDIPEEVMKSEPRIKDFLRYPTMAQYPDYRRKKESELTELEKLQFEQFKKQIIDMNLSKDDAKMAFDNLLPAASVMYEEDIEKYTMAHRDWASPYTSDWEKSNWGENLDILGFKNWLSSTTYSGYSTYGAFSNGSCIGRFITTGMVCVVTLEEVLKYDPEFNLHETHPNACALIKNFDGDIGFHTKEKSNETILQIVAKGNIKFKTAQIG